MTKLSVNINKIALLRNSRGRNFPDVYQFSERCLSLGAHGITLHPRPDQRHARYSDIQPLHNICHQHQVELNIEGYPCDDFLKHVLTHRPAQCTLVPDDPNQLTSDHGWNIAQQANFLHPIIQQLTQAGIRVSLFVDVNCPDLALAKTLGADRVELYTEPYAQLFELPDEHPNKQTQLQQCLQAFAATATKAQAYGLGVNAGHDLTAKNLGLFLNHIPHILEVSIGHALVAECLYDGIDKTITNYLAALSHP
jgi:pyridoxine 5-phosphate synthase